MEKNKVWICGQVFKSDDQPNRCWEFQGVFSLESKAICACMTNNFFIFPAIMDEVVATESMPPPRDAYYPLLESKQEGNARNQ